MKKKILQIIKKKSLNSILLGRAQRGSVACPQLRSFSQSARSLRRLMMSRRSPQVVTVLLSVLLLLPLLSPGHSLPAGDQVQVKTIKFI